MYQSFKWLREQSKLVNSSTVLGFANLHILMSLINRINSSTFKDQNLIDCYLTEFSRVICDRIIYPDTRQLVFENLLKLVKKEVSLSTLPS